MTATAISNLPPAGLQPEQAGMLVGRVGWYLGSEDLGSEVRERLANLEPQAGPLIEYGTLLADCGRFMREAEAGEIAVDEPMLRVLGLLLDQEKADLARAEAESWNEDVISGRARVQTSCS
jgi:hypothetical protein